MKLLFLVAFLMLSACASQRGSHVNLAVESDAPPASAAPAEQAAPTDERATDGVIDLGMAGTASSSISVEVTGAAVADPADGDEDEEAEEDAEDAEAPVKVEPTEDGAGAPAEGGAEGIEIIESE